MSPNAVQEDPKPNDSEVKTPPLPQPSKRKVLQKESEKLRSMSIAASTFFEFKFLAQLN